MIIAADALNTGERDAIKITLRGWMIWICAASFYLYEFFVRVAPSVMVPELQKEFNLTAAGLGMTIGVYYWIYSPAQLLAGSFLDRFGAKAVLVPASALCTLGCLVEIMGHSPFWLAAARFCQGLGSAFAFVGTMYLAAEWFPRSMLARLSGLTTSLGMAGAIFGNAGISNVVQTHGWRWALVAASGVGAVVTVLIFFVVPHKTVKRQERSAAVALSRGPGILTALKIVYSNRESWLAGIVGTALYMPLSILGALWGVEYINAVTGSSKNAGAGAVTMLYVGWLVGGPVAGWISDRTGVRRGLLLGAGVATFLVSMVVALIHGLSIPGAYILLLALGFASTSQVVCFVTAVEHNPASVAGTAIAATNMMIMLLGGIGEWFFGVLLDHFAGGHRISGYPESAYRSAIWLLPVIAAIGMVAAYLLSEPSRKIKKPSVVEPVA